MHYNPLKNPYNNNLYNNLTSLNPGKSKLETLLNRNIPKKIALGGLSLLLAASMTASACASKPVEPVDNPTQLIAYNITYPECGEDFSITAKLKDEEGLKLVCLYLQKDGETTIIDLKKANGLWEGKSPLEEGTYQGNITAFDERYNDKNFNIGELNFKIDKPPQITKYDVPERVMVGFPFKISVEAEDDRCLEDVIFEIEGKDPITLERTNGLWNGTLQLLTKGTFDYTITAIDCCDQETSETGEIVSIVIPSGFFAPYVPVPPQPPDPPF